MDYDDDLKRLLNALARRADEIENEIKGQEEEKEECDEGQ